jgi:hypothetical protein
MIGSCRTDARPTSDGGSSTTPQMAEYWWGGQAGKQTNRDKWTEPDDPCVPGGIKHWQTAKIFVQKNLPPVRKDVHDIGYIFPEPAMFVTVQQEDRRRKYLANWLGIRQAWITRIASSPRSPSPKPQLWRDFLFGLPDLTGECKTSAQKSKKAAWDLFGRDLVDRAREVNDKVVWRDQEIEVRTLGSPPQVLMRQLLWELYELNFRYELLTLDRVLALKRWEEVGEERRLRDWGMVFPGGTGVINWSASITTEQPGLWSSSVTEAWYYLQYFIQFLSAWPDPPDLLTNPLPAIPSVELAFRVLNEATIFYVRSFYATVGRPPILPRMLTL